MKNLRVGILGFGVGEQHLIAYRKIHSCEVAAVCDTDPRKRAYAQRKYPGVRVTAREEDLYADPAIDLLSIASYDSSHYRQTLRALRAGKHVFVEKPLCQTLPELRALKKAWRQKRGGCKLDSNLVLRAAPAYQRVKHLIKKGALGDAYAFDGDYLYGRLHKITQGWRRKIDHYSVMEGGGIHLVDLLVWMTGQRPRSVSAAGNKLCSRATAFRYKDYVTATLEFPSGLLARISANFGCVHPHQHGVRLYGTKATFLSDDAGPRWQSSRDEHKSAVPWKESALPASKGALIAPFVDAIQKNKNWNAETQRVFDVMGIVIASDHSLRTGKPQRVEYV